MTKADAAESEPKLLSKQARKWVLFVHVLSSSIWIGGALSMAALLLARGQHIDSPTQVYALSLAVKLLDDWLIIASCCTSALSGMLLGWKTSWGLLRYWWIALKLAVTVLIISFGSAVLGPWINETEALLRDDPGALTVPRYTVLHTRVFGLGSAQIVILGVLMYASIFKPWGKIRRRASASVATPHAQQS